MPPGRFRSLAGGTPVPMERDAEQAARDEGQEVEEARKEIHDLEQGDPPEKLEDWPEGKAKYLTYGGREGYPPPPPRPRVRGRAGPPRFGPLDPPQPARDGDPARLVAADGHPQPPPRGLEELDPQLRRRGVARRSRDRDRSGRARRGRAVLDPVDRVGAARGGVDPAAGVLAERGQGGDLERGWRAAARAERRRVQRRLAVVAVEVAAVERRQAGVADHVAA